MRNPKKGGKKKHGSGASALEPDAGGSGAMQTDVPAAVPTVWRPGVDPLGEDEELEYDTTAYDCLHSFRLGWPCLSFDVLRDDLGGPRATFPHTMFLAAGTQADTPKHNYFAVMKLTDLGQGRHGKKGEDKDDNDSEGSSEMDDSDDEGTDATGKMHYRMFSHNGGINRLRSMPQKPGVLAVWGDAGQVRVFDTTSHLQELAAEDEPNGRLAKAVLKPLQSHTHATEGFAVDWSPVHEGRLATGDCQKSLHVWEPSEAGKWQVSPAFHGHTDSIEDLQWSPTEPTVFASCSVDRSVRIWDTRQRAKSQLDVPGAHDADVNVLSWNRVVTYMLASGGEDGSLRIWDLRHLAPGGFVSHFTFHRSAVTSVEWSPYESSMLATTGADNQLAIWDLALERDPEEEASLAPEGNAAAPEDLPPQLLFIHAGQAQLKELHWHAQVPGMIISTAAEGFNAFKPSNL